MIQTKSSTNATIDEVSNMKEKLETLGIKKKEVTVAKLDIVAMYPSIQFLLVKKAVQFFSKELPKEEKNKITNCLKLVEFGTSNTRITFVDKYYKYGGM